MNNTVIQSNIKIKRKKDKENYIEYMYMYNKDVHA